MLLEQRFFACLFRAEIVTSETILKCAEKPSNNNTQVFATISALEVQAHALLKWTILIKLLPATNTVKQDPKQK